MASSFLLLTILLCISFLLLSVNANEVTVGGKSGDWKIPPSSSYSFNEWAQKARFKVGDTLVFSYEAGKDSVLQVTREAYEKCNTTSPKASYTDGNTKVKLEQPGPVYFISGKEGHCQKGQKLRLVVVTPRSSASSPAPSPSDGPAVAPSSGDAAKLTSVVGLVLGFLTLILL
ncbi:early nodulin-like protein 15 [Raphanus sativus]|uniref:Early nodulin-like protein 15 n=1 Tax=Raphanus sativus TaxID=3726 RepID=A0A6J0KI65_RAPSA|nr:early nodulin-like protein 15 [Raphanus sativus]KAJ4880627.1 early nodulin-like protein 15 [Raphanus sativus]